MTLQGISHIAGIGKGSATPVGAAVVAIASKRCSDVFATLMDDVVKG